jgi:peptidyl-prolyl cis-trans isomerase C
VNKKLTELVSALKAQGQTLESFCRENAQSEAQVRASLLTTLQRHAYISAHVSDTAVRKYFDDNRELFDRVNVRARHILLRLAPASGPAEVSAARGKLQAVREEIVSGRLGFAEAAKRYSECPSAPSGGDLGFFARRGFVEEPFARAAFALKKGEVSEIVQTSYGLHLIALIERTSGPPAEFDKIAAKVRDLAGEEMLLGIVARERAAAKIDIRIGHD